MHYQQQDSLQKHEYQQHLFLLGKKDPNQQYIVKEEINKESHQRAKEEYQKNQGVSSEPHPQDRHSGTGRGKEMRKGGQGKHNWGTYQDDMKDYGEDDNQEEQVQNDQQEVEEKQEQKKEAKEKQEEKGIELKDEDFPKLA